MGEAQTCVLLSGPRVSTYVEEQLRRGGEEGGIAPQVAERLDAGEHVAVAAHSDAKHHPKVEVEEEEEEG